MKEIVLKTELHRFENCREFAEEFSLGRGDFILTIRPIYENTSPRWGCRSRASLWRTSAAGNRPT